jgi:hypothetical protein
MALMKGVDAAMETLRAVREGLNLADLVQGYCQAEAEPGRLGR